MARGNNRLEATLAAALHSTLPIAVTLPFKPICAQRLRASHFLARTLTGVTGFQAFDLAIGLSGEEAFSGLQFLVEKTGPLVPIMHLAQHRLLADKKLSQRRPAVRENRQLLSKAGSDPRHSELAELQGKKDLAMATASEATSKQELRVAHTPSTQMQRAIWETISRVKSAPSASRGAPGPVTQFVQEAENIADLDAVVAFNFGQAWWGNRRGDV